MRKLFYSLGIILSTSAFSLYAQQEKPFVIGRVHAQLGNNLFQVATACALAWDHDACPSFPDLISVKTDNIPTNYAHVFFRCHTALPDVQLATVWQEPIFSYHPIPFQPNMKICGYFQSEKYFAHHRERLLQLFAPSSEDMDYLDRKYHWLMEHPCTVGVQLRYHYEDPQGISAIQYGKEYLKKATAFFPENALFVISSNDLNFARQNIPDGMTNIYVIEGEPYYLDLFLLSFCKHNMITNSTFGWWSAWLNQNPHKIVVSPSVWMNPARGLPTQDILPDKWIKLDAKWGNSGNPDSY